jgi:D-cysteine desulfhydrase family pyridoxal phosphate-dependent enzyme
VTSNELRQVVTRFPSIPLAPTATTIEPLPRLSSILGGTGPRLLIKRDDALSFGFGGNKVRKASLVVARAQADGADTLITGGAIQSNHARVTAATAAKLGMRAILVLNGTPAAQPTGNALLDRLLGAEVVIVDSRHDRAPKMDEIANRLRAAGRRPFEIPIGASTPLGALGFVLAIAELAEQMAPPDVIVHATSSGGTQAGLTAGCRLLGWSTRVIGISADESAAATEAHVRALIAGIADLINMDPMVLARGTPVEVDDSFVGSGYGVPTEASREAIELLARTEALFLDPTYTSKAMAGLIAGVRQQRFTNGQTVLFWHTGGQVGLFA